MNKKIMSLSALVLSMSMSQVTLACSEHMHHHSGERLVKMAEKLDLNAEQKAKIKAIGEKAHQAVKPAYEELHALRHQSNELLAAEKLDERQLERVIDKEKDVVGTMLKIKAMERRDISSVLTVKQKEKFEAMLQQHEKKYEGHKKH